MSTIALLFIAIGLVSILMAIFMPNATPGQRAAGAGVGVLALLIGALLSENREDRYDC